MLHVSRRAWHYRLWKRFHSYDSEPKNLCRYFWFCVLAVVIPLLLSVCVFVALGLLIYVIGTNLFVTGMILTLLTVGIVTGIGVFAFVRWQGDRMLRGLGAPVSYVVDAKHREPGLIRSFIRAKKQKVCPMIEVVD